MGLFIYLLRHRETTASQTGGYCGSLDPELTPAGYLMAEDFVKSYAALQWTAILSSPLQRAKNHCETPAGIETHPKPTLQSKNWLIAHAKEIRTGNYNE